jgi:hypothetical protein
MRTAGILTILAGLFVTAHFTFADTWLEMQKIIASDAAGEDRFGRSVSINGNYAIVGADGDDNNGSASGSVYIFNRYGTTWTQQQKLLASDGVKYDSFGWSVSISGDYAIVGANYDNDNGIGSGSVYIFKRDGTTWIQQQKLLASDGSTKDYFGQSVAISGDYAIVGADGDNSSTGSAYIFKRDGATWIQQGKLTASDSAVEDWFGWSVSISDDYAIVGAVYNDDNGSMSGSAYIFNRDGTTWIQQAKLTASDAAAEDCFGWSVSISGEYVIVGAGGDDDYGQWTGSAYIFKRNGTTWIQQQKLLASDAAQSNCFGDSVSISGDYAIVGADGDNSSTGSAYIFKRDGATWIQQGKLTASDGTEHDAFGYSVAIDTDSGSYATIVGAYQSEDNGYQSGSAYLFGFSPDEDLNRDCKVNLADFDEFAAHWQQTGCPTGCEDADINGDGTVDIADLLSLANAWLY